jgi:hypothetical protein
MATTLAPPRHPRAASHPHRLARAALAEPLTAPSRAAVRTPLCRWATPRAMHPTRQRTNRSTPVRRGPAARRGRGDCRWRPRSLRRCVVLFRRCVPEGHLRAGGGERTRGFHAYARGSAGDDDPAAAQFDARDDFGGGGLRAERGGNGRGRCHDRLPCQYPSRCGKPNEAMTHPSQTPGSLGGYCAQASVECAATPLLLKNSLAQLPQWVAICS